MPDFDHRALLDKIEANAAKVVTNEGADSLVARAIDDNEGRLTPKCEAAE